MKDLTEMKQIKKENDNEFMSPQVPHIVKSKNIHIDSEYAEWIARVKYRYRSAQVKAAVKVNAEKLLFNWQLGKDLVRMKAQERWGVGVVEQVSLDLRREFPDADGFSARNLWYMKQWYSFYSPENDVILHQINTELQKLVNQHKRKLHQLGAEIESEKVQQTFAEFPLPFALVPWRQKASTFLRS